MGVVVVSADTSANSASAATRISSLSCTSMRFVVFFEWIVVLFSSFLTSLLLSERMFFVALAGVAAFFAFPPSSYLLFFSIVLRGTCCGLRGRLQSTTSFTLSFTPKVLR